MTFYTHQQLMKVSLVAVFLSLLFICTIEQVVYTGNNYIKAFQKYAVSGQVGGLLLDQTQRHLLLTNSGTKQLYSVDLQERISGAVSVVGPSFFYPGSLASANFDDIFICDSLFLIRVSKMKNSSLGDSYLTNNYTSSIFAGSNKGLL